MGWNLLCRPDGPRPCSDPPESVPQVLDYRHALSGLPERITIIQDFREFQSSLLRHHDRGTLFTVVEACDRDCLHHLDSQIESRNQTEISKSFL